MALAIKAIPTLYGEEAREFRERADEVERRYMERPRRNLNTDPKILAVREILSKGGILYNPKTKADLVNNTDILANDCNLSVSSYVEQEDTREKIVIEDVNRELSELCAKGMELRATIDAIVKELEG